MSGSGFAINSTHLGPRCLPSASPEPWKYLSRFCWSLNPGGKLIIFVHGFGGDAITTWEQFVSLWPQGHGEWDLAFFGYPSRKFNVDEHTIAFIDFLKSILMSPANTINDTLKHLFSYRPELERSEKFTFDKILLVAHSMGAVICRRALIQEQNASWISNAKLILFAPAHKGAKPLMIIEAFTGISWGAPIEAAIKLVLPAFKDLTADSKALTDLETDTEQIITGKGVQEPFMASHVIHSMPDNIVHNGFFAKDPTPRQIFSTTHRKVCKPRIDWRKPLLEVIPFL